MGHHIKHSELKMLRCAILFLVACSVLSDKSQDAPLGPVYNAPQPVFFNAPPYNFNQPPQQHFVPSKDYDQLTDVEPPRTTSLLDGKCGYWRGMALFLVVGIALTGLGIIFNLYPLQEFLFQDHSSTSGIDADYIVSVLRQVDDISNVLLNMKEKYMEDDHS